MSTVQNYKCPCCGASLVYLNDALHCESCGNDFTLESLNELEAAQSGIGESKFNWDSYEPREFAPTESENLSGYVCPSCGAEITGDATLGATVCPYCGNAAIIKSRFEGALKPDYIIPFKKDKEAAIGAFIEAGLKAPFLPNEFRNMSKITEMSGVYVPFWMFDCDCNADITYRAETISVWSDSKYNYTKHNHYRLFRSGSVGFANIPVDGSSKIDNDYMESIEPFDYNDAVSFDSAYLSGYLADKYDESAEQSVPRANERVTNSTQSAFASTTSGYSAVAPISSSVRFDNGKIRYALLPVWMLSIKYLDNIYKFAINGQTGKVAGTFPICKLKRNKFFAKVFGVSLAIAAICLWLYLK